MESRWPVLGLVLRSQVQVDRLCILTNHNTREMTQLWHVLDLWAVWWQLPCIQCFEVTCCVAAWGKDQHGNRQPHHSYNTWEGKHLISPVHLGTTLGRRIIHIPVRRQTHKNNEVDFATSLEHSLFYVCNVICMLHNMFQLQWSHRQVSMMVASGMVPTWHQNIYNHHNNLVLSKLKKCALRVILNDYESTYDDLLQKNNLSCIHRERDLGNYSYMKSLTP